jgi:hypothetical protein
MLESLRDQPARWRGRADELCYTLGEPGLAILIRTGR